MCILNIANNDKEIMEIRLLSAKKLPKKQFYKGKKCSINGVKIASVPRKSKNSSSRA